MYRIKKNGNKDRDRENQQGYNSRNGRKQDHFNNWMSW